MYVETATAAATATATSTSTATATATEIDTETPTERATAKATHTLSLSHLAITRFHTIDSGSGAVSHLNGGALQHGIDNKVRYAGLLRRRVAVIALPWPQSPRCVP